MIIDFLLNLVDSWLVGVASLLPTLNIVSDQTTPEWVYSIESAMNYFRDWGIPVATIWRILYLLVAMNVAYSAVLLAVFLYNRIRGA